MGEAREAGDAKLEIRLLGPLEVHARGSAVTIGGPKPRALLALLALEAGRVVSVDTLVESLWPDEPPETAAHAIQVYVSQLRKALGSSSIVTRPPGYELAVERDGVDVHRFVRLAGEGRVARQDGDTVSAASLLRQALALWRGAALADFTYEPFAQGEIARFEELRLVTLEERLEADLELGRHGGLVSELEALVETQPLRERPRAQLMLALYRSGRQADALAAYRSAREVLVDQLGIEPGPELRELEASILRQDESLLLDEAAAPRPAMQFRRLVTIVFVDVVESMALAGSLDPEAFGGILERYFETVSSALTRHGGTVEKYAGDAVMAAFGVPVSHEDDALRAARAAVDIRTGIAALDEQLGREHGIRLQVRIGLESGEVVVTETGARQRLVTGEAVGIAANLETGAGAGEIVVGELAGRLIDHAAELESLGEVEIKGKREPVQAFRLVGLTPVAPAFETRLEAPLAGRARELAVLQKELERAAETGSARAVVVVGPPGIGKSRLCAELARRTTGSAVLWGRCLSYGDGITYWPLRDVVAQAPPGDERDAILAALEDESPPPASEIAWLFREFCEALARSGPIALVVDDLHWGEPTFLDLVEYVADKGKGPILVVCAAREELDETRPGFLEGRKNVKRVVVDPLSAADTDALLDGLGASVLESDQRARIVEAAEGNPFFLEQLLALAYEGGLAGGLPPTIQAVLAARLDRLGPGERAVLERAAVIGKRFRLEDVLALHEPEAVPTVDAHMRMLVAGGFVRPMGKGELRFRHVLVQEAVYRSAPKRLRAELHERFTSRFDERRAEIADVDEFAGYHLEQAFRLRTELGEADRRTRSLADEAGRRLGAAGMRAFRRADVPAAITLLRRGTALLPRDEALSRELRCNLAIVFSSRHGHDGAVALLEEVVADSRRAGDPRIEAWAGIELEYLQVRRGQGRTADDLLSATAVAIPIFELAGDHRYLGRAWLFAGWAHGGRRGDHAAWAEAAERALVHYRAANWPTSTSVGELACAMYWGPTPVSEAIARCEQLLGDASLDRIGVGYLETFLGGLHAQRGDFDRGRSLVETARDALVDLGHHAAVMTYCDTVRGEMELLASDGVAAERVLAPLCDDLRARHDYSQLASRASDLAEALMLQDRLDEADAWTEVAEQHAAVDDVNAQLMWRSIRARIVARRGETVEGERLAREGVEIVATTDDLNRHGEALRDLAEVLRLAGRETEAGAALEAAGALFERKGNLVAKAHVQAQRNGLALA